MDQQINILVLEDDDELREMVGDSLRDEGFSVVDVANGLAAVEAAREQEFDLIVLDVKMEGIDGLEALAQIKERFPGLHSLVITGYSTESDSVRALQLGVQEYLRKPFSLAQLLDAVHRLVRRVIDDRQREKRDLAVQKTVLWALETVAHSLQLSSEVDLVERGREVEHRCQLLGLSEQSCRQARLAYLTLAVKNDLDTETDFIFDGLLPEVGWLMSRVPGQEEFGLKDETPIQAWVVAAILDQSLPSQTPEEVRTVLESELKTPRKQGRRSSEGLLSVARMLSGSGDTEGARLALEDLVREGVTHEVAQGYYELGRLAHSDGDAESAKANLSQAVEAAERMEPGRGALVRLEAGLLLMTMEDNLGTEWVRRTVPVFEDLHMQSPLAQARLALATVGESSAQQASEALNCLLAPQFFHDLVRSADWLLPTLLETGSKNPSVGKALRRLVRDVPRGIQRLVRASKLSPKGRMSVLEAIEAVGKQGHHETLELLAGDQEQQVRTRAAQLLNTQENQVVYPVLRLFSFGIHEAYVGEYAVPDDAWGTQKVRYLLAYLAAKDGTPATRDVLLDAFWPESPMRAKRYLYQATSMLRRALQPPDWEGTLNYVERSNQGLYLSSDLPRWHDLGELEKSMKQAKAYEDSSQVDRAIDVLKAGLSLYRGPYLEGCYMEWALAQRTRIEHLVADAFERLMLYCVGLERWRECHEVALRLLELDPYNQKAHETVLDANLGLGRPEEALRHFKACKKLLQREMGLEPTIEIVRKAQLAKMAL